MLVVHSLHQFPEGSYEHCKKRNNMQAIINTVIVYTQQFLWSCNLESISDTHMCSFSFEIFTYALRNVCHSTHKIAKNTYQVLMECLTSWKLEIFCCCDWRMLFLLSSSHHCGRDTATYVWYMVMWISEKRGWVRNPSNQDNNGVDNYKWSEISRTHSSVWIREVCHTIGAQLP